MAPRLWATTACRRCHRTRRTVARHKLLLLLLARTKMAMETQTRMRMAKERTAMGHEGQRRRAALGETLSRHLRSSCLSWRLLNQQAQMTAPKRLLHTRCIQMKAPRPTRANNLRRLGGPKEARGKQARRQSSMLSRREKRSKGDEWRLYMQSQTASHGQQGRRTWRVRRASKGRQQLQLRRTVLQLRRRRSRSSRRRRSGSRVSQTRWRTCLCRRSANGQRSQRSGPG